MPETADRLLVNPAMIAWENEAQGELKESAY